MSDSQNAPTALEDEGKDRETHSQSLRFTPLRSYVKRARTLTREARDELALSRLIPVPKLQS